MVTIATLGKLTKTEIGLYTVSFSNYIKHTKEGVDKLETYSSSGLRVWVESFNHFYSKVRYASGVKKSIKTSNIRILMPQWKKSYESGT